MDRLVIASNGLPMLLSDEPPAPAPTESEPIKEDPQLAPLEQAIRDPDHLRRVDVIRDLAREMDDFQSGDIKELLEGKFTREPTEEELKHIADWVRHYKIDHLVDMLDDQLRSLFTHMTRGRRKVRISAPRGWIRKTFNSLTDDEILSIISRLEQRGHKREDLASSILGRIRKKERADEIGARLAALPEQDKIYLSDDVFDTDDIDMDPTWALTEMIDNVNKSIGEKSDQPINIYVNVENKPQKKIVKRDPKTGLIEEIEDVGT